MVVSHRLNPSVNGCQDSEKELFAVLVRLKDDKFLSPIVCILSSGKESHGIKSGVVISISKVGAEI